MKLFSTTLDLLGTLTLVQGRFISTCRDTRMIDGGVEAQTREANGNYRFSRLDLNHCLGNRNGELVWRKY
ncbi:hypothetical protein PG997_001928 [Apiospora hydei]|uniref:Cyanovirin-N domain-containing protein n=1 Tax=Apiospora hydei TaxID=1337664 RepID=A0ABR1X7R7_9PEZI